MVIRRSWLAAGDEVNRFERLMAANLQLPYVLAVSSGHAALHLALLTLGITAGDEVILPSYTVSDLLNAVCYVGATPVLTDLGPGSFVMDENEVRKVMTRKTRCIIVPHMFGFFVDVQALRQFHVPIIEDCAQSLGTMIPEINKPPGTQGDLAIFSFYVTKMITTGQGGMVATAHRPFSDRLRDLVAYNAPHTYAIRYNYQMTDLAAAIGIVQFAKLRDFIRRRKEIAVRYRTELDRKGLRYAPAADEPYINHFRFILRFDTEAERNAAQMLLNKSGIAARPPLRQYELLHVLLGKDGREFPHTDKLAGTTLSLPIYPMLSDGDVERICRVLKHL